MASQLIYLILWACAASLVLAAEGIRHSSNLDNLGFLQEPEDVVGVKGQPIRLECLARSPHSPVTYSWKKNNEFLQQTQRITFQNGTLYIKKVVRRKRKDITDEGVYHCIAKDDKGIISSRPARISIASLGRFFTNPAPVSVHRGGAARMSCAVKESLPLPHYSWLKNNQTLTQDSRLVMLPSGVLQINQVQDSDAGQYVCMASNVAGERLSEPAALRVLPAVNRPPSIIARPANISVVVGQGAILECLADGDPMPDVQWHREGGQPISSAVSTILGRGNLLISSVNVSETGVYTCTAKSSAYDQVVVARATVTVHVPPKITELPVDANTPVAGTGRFNCKFQGTPVPSIHWLHNGEPVVLNGRMTVNNIYTLVIIQTTHDDAGYYQCVVQNQAGYISAVAKLNIEKRANEPSAPTNLKAVTISSEVINVSWSESPPVNGEPTIAYSVHYLPTQGGKEHQEVVKEPHKRITRLLPHTNYTFYVRAYNTYSSSRQSEEITQMTAEDVPKSAPSVTLASHADSKINVYWDKLPPKEARGEITQYKIIYRRKNVDEETYILVPGDQTSYEITGLAPRTTYEVRLLARTSQGYPDLPRQTWATVTTTNSPNPQAPEVPDLKVIVLNATAVQTSWRYPNTSQTPVDGFKMKCKKIGDEEGSGQTFNVPKNVFKKIIANLEMGTQYEFQVVAYNSYGDGQAAVRDASTLEVPTSAVPVPIDVHAHSEYSTTMFVNWRVASEPIIYSYELRYMEDNKEDTKELLELKEKSAQLSGLKPYTMYRIAVRSFTHNAHSEYSKEVMCRTKEGKPGMPKNLKVTVRSPTSVEVSWQAPDNPNGIIREYTVHYKYQDQGSASFRILNGSATFAKLAQLHPGKVYQVEIQASTRAGNGPRSEKLEFKLEVPPPSEPIDNLDDTKVGIIAGVSIGIVCVAICIVLIILKARNRQRPSEPEAVRYYGNGHLPQSNGGNLYHQCTANGHEDSITPMLPANCTTADDPTIEIQTPILKRKGIPTVNQGYRPNGIAISSRLGQKYGVNGRNMESPDSQHLLQNTSSEPEGSFHGGVGSSSVSSPEPSNHTSSQYLSPNTDSASSQSPPGSSQSPPGCLEGDITHSDTGKIPPPPPPPPPPYPQPLQQQQQQQLQQDSQHSKSTSHAKQLTDSTEQLQSQGDTMEEGPEPLPKLSNSTHFPTAMPQVEETEFAGTASQLTQDQAFITTV
ncbi:protogenin B-like [Lingula anatina]|uniref:Protogenin B-like n=1 Tax=Lingula anatina TaxID=7574 RepID=A0A1S3HJZ1_LINAN|nr:protogenin B-like [Lingula anatina]|eukprot:XP_013386337.1 protogenin B-like [Lingula anatina]